MLQGLVTDGTLDEDWKLRTIEVLNKADLMGGIANMMVKSGMIAVSAITGEGLKEAMAGAQEMRPDIERRVRNRRTSHAR